MYIQVTTRCNMQCAHCMFACTSRGKDMSLEVFQHAVDVASNYDEIVAIGGGEPTLHPDILLFIGYAVMMSSDDYKPFMVTNGAMDVELWRKLLRSNIIGRIRLHVSKDPWHDVNMIPDKIWEDADKYKLWWGEPIAPGGGSTTRRIATRGRAKSKKSQEMLEIEGLEAGYKEVIFEETDCLDARVAPDGYVYVDAPGAAIKVGPLSDDSFEAAKQIVDEIENGEVNVSDNPMDYRS